MTFYQWFENECMICKSDACRDAALAGWIAGGADVEMRHATDSESTWQHKRSAIMDLMGDRSARDVFLDALKRRGYDGFTDSDAGMILDAAYEAVIKAEARDSVPIECPEGRENGENKEA